MSAVREMTRKSRLTLAAIVGLAVIVSLPTAVSAISLQRTPRIASSSGGTARYAGFQRKPFRIIYSGDGAALLSGRGRLSNHLTWTAWNDREGRAEGADWHDNCVPDCARGTYFAYRANIRVYRPRHVAGDLLFTRMTVTYTGRRPPYPANARGPVTFRLDHDTRYKTFFWTGS